MVTQRQTGLVERTLGRKIHRHHQLVAPGADAAGLVEIPFALAACKYPPLRD